MANAFGRGEAAMPGFPMGNPLAGAGLLETLELVRKAWTSFALPPGMAPTLDPAEIERRVAELKSIEQWLAMNLTMLRGTIQAFEIQQSTLNTLRSFGESSAAAVSAAAEAARTQFPSSSSAPDEAGIAEDLAEYEESTHAPGSDDREDMAAADDDAAAGSGANEDRAAAGQAKPDESKAQSAFGVDPVAWWDLVQKQFTQVASAAMASMPKPRPAEGPDDAAQTGAQTEAPATKAAMRNAGAASESQRTTAAPAKRTATEGARSRAEPTSGGKNAAAGPRRAAPRGKNVRTKPTD